MISSTFPLLAPSRLMLRRAFTVSMSKSLYNSKAYAAALSLMELENKVQLIYTSIWRSANGSLWAIKNKKGAMAPGYSAHNYGLAVDLTIDQILEEKILSSYDEILDVMEEHGWHCHRRDRSCGP